PIGVAKLGSAIRYFQKHDIHHATMAGKIHKIQLFRLRTWIRHCPDWTTIRAFWPHFVSGKEDRKDDTLLTAICDAFARGQVHFGPATDYAPELLVNYGQLTKHAPTTMQQKDIEFGWQAAREMGRLDIGQSVVVKNRTMIAVEAIEGTDECIKRGAQLCGGGYTVVKVAKPQQDMRFDVPTIGLGTLETMAATGGRVLAVEEKMTVMVDQQATVEFADRHNISIVALHAHGQYDLPGVKAPAA
ncbi:MAG: UDP-2,3-diacylglucosamine diphosphatase LpxI, partial [Pirellulales bacterium]|nr:UDP-2,3-diacylglucosamine diphosphatase LpxI [Pirellulales bacterium]